MTRCRKCGAKIGVLGRLWQVLRIQVHRCVPPRPWTIDRDGRVHKNDEREVVLRAKQ